MKKLSFALLICLAVLAVCVSCSNGPEVKTYEISIKDDYCAYDSTTLRVQTYEDRLDALAKEMLGKRFSSKDRVFDYTVEKDEDGYLTAICSGETLYFFFNEERVKTTDRLQNAYVLDWYYYN